MATASGYNPSQWSEQDQAFLGNNTQTSFGNTAPSKPWYQNEQFAGAVAGGISGITNYLLEQERQKGYKSLQNDRFANEERTMNAAVQRASSMPLLKRFAKPKKV